MKHFSIALVAIFCQLRAYSQELQTQESTPASVPTSEAEVRTIEIVAKAKRIITALNTGDKVETRYSFFVISPESFPFIADANESAAAANIRELKHAPIYFVEYKNEQTPVQYLFRHDLREIVTGEGLPESLTLTLLNKNSVIELVLNSDQLKESTSETGLKLSVKLRTPSTEELEGIDARMGPKIALVNPRRVEMSSSGNDPFLRSRAEQLVSAMVMSRSATLGRDSIFVHNGSNHVAGSGVSYARGGVPAVGGPANGAPAVADAVAVTDSGTYRVVIFAGTRGTYTEHAQNPPHPLSNGSSTTIPGSIRPGVNDYRRDPSGRYRRRP